MIHHDFNRVESIMGKGENIVSLIENTVRKGVIAHYKQLLLFSEFSKDFY